MPETKEYNYISPDKKAKGWERLKQSQTWAANAEVPLMVRLSRANRLMNQHLEEETGLSTSQMRILFEALEADGISQLALHKHYKVDPASITRTVQAMERDGLITRRPDISDNRLMRVYATQKGRDLAEVLPERLARFEQAMLSGLSDSEILELHRLLERVEQKF